MFAVLGVGIILFGALASYFEHKQKMLKLEIEMRNRERQGNDARIEALESQVRALRDTTSQYDLSFDAALDRIERRVETIERQQIPAESAQVSVRTLR